MILLSLCIPTYNRVETLMVMLDHVICDPDFDEEVEIVISDNCSTDNTEMEVRKITSKHHNVKYYRNSENLKDQNFYLALSRGEGAYLKLLNDYITFRIGALKMMKDYVRRYLNSDINLFFYSNLRSPYRSFKEVQFENVDSFAHDINNKITWIANFGVWKRNFRKLGNSDKLWRTQLAQMDWTLHEVSLRKTIVVNYHGYRALTVPNKKMSYAFFVPHVINYYDIYKTYMDRGLISQGTVDYDKYRVLSHFVGSRIIQYLYLEKEVSFDLVTVKKILDEYFGNIPYYRYLKLKGCFLKTMQKLGVLTAVKFIRRLFSRKS